MARPKKVVAQPEAQAAIAQERQITGTNVVAHCHFSYPPHSCDEATAGAITSIAVALEQNARALHSLADAITDRRGSALNFCN